MNRHGEESAAVENAVSLTSANRDTFYKKVEQHIRTTKQKYCKAIIQLEKLLLRAPMLAMTDPLAKKIKKEMEAKSVRRIEISGEFFRARP